MADSFSTGTEKQTMEAADLIKRCAAPLGGSIKAQIRRAGERLGFTFNHTKSLWYRELRRIDAGEMDRLREHAARLEKELAIEHLVALRRSLAKEAEAHSCLPIAAIDNVLVAIGVEICPMGIRQKSGERT